MHASGLVVILATCLAPPNQVEILIYPHLYSPALGSAITLDNINVFHLPSLHTILCLLELVIVDLLALLRHLCILVAYLLTIPIVVLQYSY